MLVREVLKTKGRSVVVVAQEATVAEAIRRLVGNDIGSLPVVDESGHLVGIFTERDVLHGVDDSCEQFHRRRVGEVMTRDPVTCSPLDNVHDCMGKMSDHQVGQLPVLAEGEVVGVVSVGDVIKLLFETVQRENQHLLEYLYGPG